MSDVMMAGGTTEEKFCPVCFTETNETVAMEPELDWPYRFYECPECGTTESFVYVGGAEEDNGSCAVGVPEGLRARVSATGDEQDRQDRMKALASPEAVEARMRALPMFRGSQ